MRRIIVENRVEKLSDREALARVESHMREDPVINQPYLSASRFVDGVSVFYIQNKNSHRFVVSKQ